VAFPADFKQEQLKAEMVARIMAEAIHQLGGDRPVTLTGHSTGGVAVLKIAAQYPKLARRIVGISGFAHGCWTGVPGMYQRFVRMGSAGKGMYKILNSMSGASPSMSRAILRIYASDVKALYANPRYY
jgi:pimeloyl-ACP methyl ester carboxylesterase